MTKKEMLEGLGKLILQGALTKAPFADYGTYVCAVDKKDATYHQFQFESLPETHQEAFRHQKVGAMIGSVKIVALFDAWPDAIIEDSIKTVSKPIDS